MTFERGSFFFVYNLSVIRQKRNCNPLVSSKCNFFYIISNPDLYHNQGFKTPISLWYKFNDMKNKVLLPTDFSANAAQAIPFAASVCKNTQVELVLLYVTQLATPDINFPASFVDEVMTMQIKESNERLQALAKEITDTYNISVSYRTEIGGVAGMIAEVCEEELVGLVVMGTHGASGFFDKWLGSTTASVLGKIDCPLWVIPQGATAKPIQNVAIATDYKINDVPFVNTLLTFWNDTALHFHFLHVLKNEEDTLDTGNFHPEFLPSFAFDLHEVNGEDEVAAISSFVQHHPIDALVVSHHHRTFFEELIHKSVAKELIFNSKIPVLIFHK